MTWRERLREAVEGAGRKHPTIAWEAGIDPATLSRISTVATSTLSLKPSYASRTRPA